MNQRRGSIPFLYALVLRKEDGSMKVQIYHMTTHTDQYLNFESHHQLQHKIRLIRALYNRSGNIVTDPSNASDEIAHLNKALAKCGYPSWMFKKVRHRLDQRLNKTMQRKQDESRQDCNHGVKDDGHHSLCHRGVSGTGTYLMMPWCVMCPLP